MKNEEAPHIPVLRDEVLRCLRDHMRPEGVFVDCTVGYGGHSEAILETFANLRLTGLDRDPEAIDYSTRRLARFGARFQAIRGAFSSRLPDLLRGERIVGLLADFGVSSLQLDKKARGFSFLSDNLDMRMDPSADLCAHDVVNGYGRAELERIFREYAEEPAWRKAADAVMKAREAGPIESGRELAEILERALPRKKGRTHPATALFQAIRIEVNDELGEIVRLLDALEANPPRGAVVALITFHSLEDRLVKQRFKRWSTACICPSEAFRCECGGDHALGRVLNRKPIVAAAEEVRANSRSRSAKLRCFKFED